MLAVLLALAHGGDTVAHYWQQQVAYVISAALDEPSGVLTGQVRIRYVNRSPDTLRDFYVHQYLNAFRPGSRWSAADSAEGRGRVQPLAGPHHPVERVTRAAAVGQVDAPRAARSRRQHDGRDRMAGAALHRAAPPGAGGGGGAALRLRAVVSQGRGVRPARLGGPPALSGG